MSSETSFRNVSPRLATSANIDLLSLCLGCKMDCTIRSDTRVELRIAIEKVNENRGLALFEDQGKIWTPPNPTRGFSVQNPGGRFSFCCVPRLNLLEKIVGFPPPSHALPPRGKGWGEGGDGKRNPHMHENYEGLCLSSWGFRFARYVKGLKTGLAA